MGGGGDGLGWGGDSSVGGAGGSYGSGGGSGRLWRITQDEVFRLRAEAMEPRRARGRAILPRGCQLIRKERIVRKRQTEGAFSELLYRKGIAGRVGQGIIVAKNAATTKWWEGESGKKAEREGASREGRGRGTEGGEGRAGQPASKSHNKAGAGRSAGWQVKQPQQRSGEEGENSEWERRKCEHHQIKENAAVKYQQMSHRLAAKTGQGPLQSSTINSNGPHQKARRSVPKQPKTVHKVAKHQGLPPTQDSAKAPQEDTNRARMKARTKTTKECQYTEEYLERDCSQQKCTLHQI